MHDLLDKAQELPEGPWDVCYADPPWPYDFSRSKSRSIESHYPPMTIEDICNLPPKGFFAKSSVLYLWATKPKMKEAFIVMEAWDFEYKTEIVWDKVTVGNGYWCRDRHENLMIGTRGKFSPPPEDMRPDSVQRIKKSSRHSRKPDFFRWHIERTTPDLKRIELFATEEYPNWTAWGNTKRQTNFSWAS